MNFKRFNGSTWETVRHKIYGSGTDSLTAFPAMIQASGEALTDYLISGNTVQNGTPTPQAPVDVVGCGNIWNHWNGTLVRYYLGKSTLRNEVAHYVNGAMFQIKAAPNVDYTVEQDSSPATALLRIYRSNNPLVNDEGVNIAFNSMVEWNGTGTPKATINSGSFKYIWVQFGGAWYDSYGASATISLVGDYVIPITVNGTEHPIYLGQVETTRWIKKLVLTGGESGWLLYQQSSPFWQYEVYQFWLDNIVDSIQYSSLYSTIAPFGVTSQSRQNYEYGCYIVSSGKGIAFQMAGAKDTFTNITAWKSYLAAQYAAGTPVTVWYVLAEPETAAVNEPIHKIGNYADTITMAQAGVTIPTSDGDNTISFGTTVQPSAMSATFKGWHPVQAAKQYDGNDWD